MPKKTQQQASRSRKPGAVKGKKAYSGKHSKFKTNRVESNTDSTSKGSRTPSGRKGAAKGGMGTYKSYTERVKNTIKKAGKAAKSRSVVGAAADIASKKKAADKKARRKAYSKATKKPLRS